MPMALSDRAIDPFTHALGRRAGQNGPLMLMYHAVVPGGGIPDWPWAVSSGRLEAQLDYLRDSGWHTMTMGELAAIPGKPAPRTVVITFDDGYADNLVAFEMLARRNMRATWFIVSGSVGQEPKWPADGRPAGRLLSREEMREMHDAGMEIGSHTRSHCRLTEVDAATVEAELRGSKAELEGMLGRAVSSFAYPYGKFDDRIAEAVRAAGYGAACTTRSGWATRDGDTYRLRRLSIMNTDTVSTLVRKLTFADNDVTWQALARYASNRLRARLPF